VISNKEAISVRMPISVKLVMRGESVCILLFFRQTV